MNVAIFKDFKVGKKFGYSNSEEGFGVQTKLSAEIVKAEYEVDKKTKEFKVSKNGKKKIKVKMKIDMPFGTEGKKKKIGFTVSYYESSINPTLEQYTDKKYAVVSLNNGGEGFGEFKLRNFVTEEGSISSTIELSGAIVKIVDEDMTYEEYGGRRDVFGVDEALRVNAKGCVVIPEGYDCDMWLSDVYNAVDETILLNLYIKNGEYSEPIPFVIDGVTEDKAVRLYGFMKDAENTIIGISGIIDIVSKENTTIVKVEVDEDDMFSSGGNDKTYDYLGFIKVNRDDKGRYKLFNTKNKGLFTYIVGDSDATSTGTSVTDEDEAF